MDERLGPWYRALAAVEHEGALFEAGALVGWEHPVLEAHPELFERVRVMSDGRLIAEAPGERPSRSRARPAMLMSDGSTRSIEATAPPASSPVLPARGPGRPPWTADLFHARYRAVVARLGPSASTADIAAAPEFVVLERQLRRLVARFGRPAL